MSERGHGHLAPVCCAHELRPTSHLVVAVAVLVWVRQPGPRYSQVLPARYSQVLLAACQRRVLTCGSRVHVLLTC